MAELAGQELRMADSVQWEEISGLDRETMTRVRVNQAFFRTMILAGYRTACAVCSLPVPALLVASHIVPWSIDPSHRMNPRNGICLCSLHDKAFDRGLMGFDDELNVRLSATMLAASGSESIRRFFLAF